MNTFRCLVLRLAFVLGIAAGLSACSDGVGGLQGLVPARETVVDEPPANAAPEIAGNPTAEVIAGDPYLFEPVASDPDGDALSFTVDGLPIWASFDTFSGTLSGTPSDADAGEYLGIVIAVSDGELAESLGPFSITVEVAPEQEPPPPTNGPPMIANSPPMQVIAGDLYLFEPLATDPDGDRLSFSIDALPPWAAFNTNNGILSGTPSDADQGEYPGIVITASDGQLSDTLGPFSITVEPRPVEEPPPPEPPPNEPPMIDGTPRAEVFSGDLYAFTPTASDPNGDLLTFSIVNPPPWAAFDSATGTLSGAPSAADQGVFSNILIIVSDGEFTDSLGPFSVTVEALPNDPPEISGDPPARVVAGELYRFEPEAIDPDGDDLNFSVTNRPAWASFDTASGALAGTPSEADQGAFPGILITVSDGEATASLGPFSITVEAPPNAPPSIAGTPDSQVIAGESYVFEPSASDPDGDELTFSITNRPNWADFDAVTGVLAGAPSEADQGPFPAIVITVSDGELADSLGPFTITVEAPPNEPPQISGTPPSQVVVAEPYRFEPTASDPDGDELTFTIASPPSWATFDTATGVLSGTPSETDQGVDAGIVIIVSDGELTDTLGPFSITVEPTEEDEEEPPPNEPPEIAGHPPLQVIAGERYLFEPTATDPDGDELTFSIVNRPDWAVFDTVTGNLSGTPSEADQGVDSGIVISVSDGELSASLSAFSITVAQQPNEPPQISGSPQTRVVANEPYRFEPMASDPDGDNLTFSVVNRPLWASFDVDAGTLSGMPTEADEGIYSGIDIIVSDGELTDSLGAFSITVEPPPNDPPQIMGTPPLRVVVGELYRFAPDALDPNGDDLTFSIVNPPSWAAFDTETGMLSGTPSDADEGEFTGIDIIVSDGDLVDALGAFSITVEPPPNDPPQITGDPPLQVIAGEQYRFQPEATDPDDDELSFSITNPPSWATFDTDSGELSGTPSEADTGPYPAIVITVSDGDLTDSLGPFTITVEPPPNQAPEISGDPDLQVVAGDVYLFEPAASDPDGDELTFSIENRPAWASFDPNTGALSGTPDEADEGAYPDIVITVSDGDLTDALAPFSITVEPPPNRPPEISGTPPADVVAGEAYLFEPVATDPDGDPLTFTIEAQPAWASFDTDTGALSGTPSSADEGEYTGIVITASDGDLTDALGSFSITVELPPTRIDDLTLEIEAAESSVDLMLAAVFGADVISTFGTGTFPLSGTLEVQVESAGEEVLSVSFESLTLDYVVDPDNPTSIFIDVDDNGMLVTVEARFPYDESINPGNPVDAFDPQLWVRADGGGDSDIGTQTGTGGQLTLEAPRYAFVGTANTFNSPAAPDGFPLQLNPYNRFSRDSFDGAPTDPRFLDGLVTVEGCRVLFHGSFLGYAVAGVGLVQSALIHSGFFRAGADLPDC
ncbi:MAG: putative Ig domain-containing protein [Pseudomonadota bacterium]